MTSYCKVGQSQPQRYGPDINKTVVDLRQKTRHSTMQVCNKAKKIKVYLHVSSVGFLSLNAVIPYHVVHIKNHLQQNITI